MSLRPVLLRALSAASLTSLISLAAAQSEPRIALLDADAVRSAAVQVLVKRNPEAARLKDSIELLRLKGEQLSARYRELDRKSEDYAISYAEYRAVGEERARKENLLNTAAKAIVDEAIDQVGAFAVVIEKDYRRALLRSELPLEEIDEAVQRALADMYLATPTPTKHSPEPGAATEGNEVKE